MNKRQKELRLKIIEMAIKTNNGHIAPALSCIDIIDDIYKNMANDDVFILSKGHGCLSLYVILQELGYNPDIYKGHPDKDTENGISCTTGSLGHGLPVGIGMALSKRIKKEPGFVYVLMGDGECQEGTTWESINILNHLKLNNIKVYVDNNGLQALERTMYFKLPKCDSIQIINTIKGNGISFMENNPIWHSRLPNSEEIKILRRELQ